MPVLDHVLDHDLLGLLVDDLDLIDADLQPQELGVNPEPAFRVDGDPQAALGAAEAVDDGVLLRVSADRIE